MTGRPEMVMYLNGELVPSREGLKALQQPELQSASGFYDSERTFNGQVFKLRHHLERLYNGLNYSKIDPGVSMEELEELTLRLLELNRPHLRPGDEFTITQIVSVGAAPSPDDRPKVNVVIYCQPLDFTSFAGSYRRGVRIVTPVTYGMPQQPAEGNRQRVYSLMTGRDGFITECTGANFMFVRDSRIMLPDRRNVLPGVSMRTVLELADSLGIEVDEDDYSTHDVYTAEEAFVSSTRNCMLPVATINGLTLTEELPGPVTGRLLEAWGEMVGLDFVQQALDHLPPESRNVSTGEPQAQ